MSESKSDTTDQIIELSIEETNKLRAELGLKPLSSSSSTTNPSSSSSATVAIHAPAPNTGNELAMNKRVEDIKLRREVEAGLLKLKSEQVLSEDSSSTLDLSAWASQMRTTTKKNSKTQDNSSHPSQATYTINEMMNQNITLAHSSSAFEAGSSTILTLADRSIIDDYDTNANHRMDDEHELENIQFVERKLIEDNLREKRLFGHGYRGIDDDEFDITNPTIISKGNTGGGSFSSLNQQNPKKTIKLNDVILQNNTSTGTDLFAFERGQAISYNPRVQQQQSDFMTMEEEEDKDAMEDYGPSSFILAQKNNIITKKREGSKKSKDRKKSKKVKGEKEEDIKNKEKGDQLLQQELVPKEIIPTSESDLIKTLEESSTNNNLQQRKKRRRRIVNDNDDETSSDDEQKEKQQEKVDSTTHTQLLQKDEKSSIQSHTKKEISKFEKYQRIMEKGNVRSDLVFNNRFKQVIQPKKEFNPVTDIMESLENNDESLEKSLSEKAQRLARLKALNQNRDISTTSSLDLKGAAAVAFTVKSLDEKYNNKNKNDTSKEEKKITFQLDPTIDFAMSLRAKSQKTLDVVKVESNEKNNNNIESVVISSLTNEEEEEQHHNVSTSMGTLESMIESKDDLDNALFGEAPVTIGRGLANVIGLLKQTGEMAGKNAGREEMKGRAKDIRTYEDYEKLNLNEVVKIDAKASSAGGPHEKDIEYAHREIKLDYRDEHGRLLTRKEAYRNLCYQFHGYGSGKRNQERRLKQIEREKLEKTTSSENQSTLAALKVTQKATGKAFIVHKT